MQVEMKPPAKKQCENFVGGIAKVVNKYLRENLSDSMMEFTLTVKNAKDLCMVNAPLDTLQCAERILPNAYIIANVFSFRDEPQRLNGDLQGRLISCNLTKSVPDMNNPVWNSSLQLFFKGNSELVLTIMDRKSNRLGSDECIGQCILNLADYPDVLGSIQQELHLTLPISDVTRDEIYLRKNNTLSVNKTDSKITGNLSIIIHVPPVDFHMCGYFIDVYRPTFWFRGEEKVWVTLVENDLTIWDGPYGETYSRLIHHIACNTITNFEEFQCEVGSSSETLGSSLVVVNIIKFIVVISLFLNIFSHATNN